MAETLFKRKIYDKMLAWKKNSAGGTALLIEGPRRVGKSTIARTFAEEEYRSHVIIDFAKGFFRRDKSLQRHLRS